MEIFAAILAMWALGLLSLAFSLPPEFWQDADNHKAEDPGDHLKVSID